MRGTEEVQDAMFSYISAEQRVPKDHPLRPIRKIMDEVLKRLSPEFDGMYGKVWEDHQLRRRNCCGHWWRDEQSASCRHGRRGLRPNVAKIGEITFEVAEPTA